MKISWRVVILTVAFVLLLGMALLSVVSILPERRVCFKEKGCVLVVMAQTEGEKQRGLAGVRWLPDTLGMLFVFEEADFHSFWMKGMRVPLDFVWLNDGVVVDVTENVFPEAESEKSWTIYKPILPASMVLEVPAGWVARRGVAVGDRLFW